MLYHHIDEGLNVGPPVLVQCIPSKMHKREYHRIHARFLQYFDSARERIVCSDTYYDDE
jgi:hypothetical protein